MLYFHFLLSCIAKKSYKSGKLSVRGFKILSKYKQSTIFILILFLQLYVLISFLLVASLIATQQFRGNSMKEIK